ERDVAVLSAGRVPTRPQHVARVADVRLREAPEDLLRLVVLVQTIADLLVVEIALRDRLLENGRVRRDADHGIVAHQPLEPAGLEHLAREEVDPDALAA